MVIRNSLESSLEKKGFTFKNALIYLNFLYKQAG